MGEVSASSSSFNYLSSAHLLICSTVCLLAYIPQPGHSPDKVPGGRLSIFGHLTGFGVSKLNPIGSSPPAVLGFSRAVLLTCSLCSGRTSRSLLFYRSARPAPSVFFLSFILSCLSFYFSRLRRLSRPPPTVVSAGPPRSRPLARNPSLVLRLISLFFAGCHSLAGY